MAKFEKIDTNKVKMNFNITNEELLKSMKDAYSKNKNKIQIPGFRKGKAPYSIVEKYYGKGYFLTDGIDIILESKYVEAIESLELEPVAAPEINFENIDKWETEDLMVVAEFFVKPEVIVNKYRGLTYKKPDVFLTEDEINKAIEDERKKNARLIEVTELPAKLGDKVVMDFEGFVDEAPLEGGKEDGFEIELGSNTFIKGFEEQVVGHKIEEPFTIDVTFPEDYMEQSLANKNAKFNIVIKSIQEYELPELDDEFAQDISDFETLKDYRDNLKEELLKRKKDVAESQKQNEIFTSLLENVEVSIPRPMIDREIKELQEQYFNNFKKSGLDISRKQFFEMTGMKEEDFNKQYEQQATEKVKFGLVIDKIVELENFIITDEEIADLLKKNENYKEIEDEKLKSIINSYRELLATDIKKEKAYNLIIDSSIEELA